MARRETGTIIQHLRRMVLRADGAGMTDGQLLTEFVLHRDAAAFESLVRRHGLMVMGVCRRILHDPHDAEDAFQSTFLVLARKAASVSPPEMVGNWLYGVAHTTAVRLRAAKAKRLTREKHMADMPETKAEQNDLQDDLKQLLDEELVRLPDKYRLPIVLCDLEGRPRREVARQLDLPEGTLSSRLTTGRRMLAKRLARHALAASGGTLTVALSNSPAWASMSVSLMGSTVQAAMLAAAGQTATGLISVQVAGLAEGVLKSMFLTKLKAFMGSVVVIACLGGVTGLIYQAQAAEKRDPPKVNESQQAPKSETVGLEGTWNVVSLEVEGKRQDSDALLKKPVMAIRWTFAGNKIKIWGGDKAIEATFKSDSSTAPKRIDLTFYIRDGDVEEQVTALGIYSLDGDNIKVCFILDPELLVRPLKFDVKDVQGMNYYVLRRERSSVREAVEEKRSAAKKDEKPRPDKDQLQGTWKTISMVDNGKKDEPAVGDEWTFKDAIVRAKYQQKKNGTFASYLRFRLDQTTNPKQIDMVGGEADDLFDTTVLDKRLDDADKRKEGIYSIDGDTLTICISRKKGDRPASFESKKGSDYILIVFNRETEHRPRAARMRDISGNARRIWILAQF